MGLRLVISTLHAPARALFYDAAKLFLHARRSCCCSWYFRTACREMIAKCSKECVMCRFPACVMRPVMMSVPVCVLMLAAVSRVLGALPIA